ncbi:acireductone dioxygenase [Polyangium sp. 6x1]|uniref:1,2-dihydroxy-3-keto-5-methylthiopentene dioxygenase n=1 Tax=Polyangium sp. 6x1 TaxID=3042689 RepID=UPI002482B481|nr:acireductone dioxygenase [Polyangium sp. 6x1]MDI1451939.1 acireductone dioxygenase [Polyangium sp. 6x1]
MSSIHVFWENDPRAPVRVLSDHAKIAAYLGLAHIRFEVWDAPFSFTPKATAEEILAAYQAPIEKLCREGGYPAVDVARLSPDPQDPSWPAKARAAREKFLEEHTHGEDEVRFFVHGAGVFYLRLSPMVVAVRCERGDLLSVPAGTRHWFDMGAQPDFCAIRFFGTPEGWVASFTGDDIARGFPDADTLARGEPW